MQYSRPVQVTFSTILILLIGKLFFELSDSVLLGIFFNLVFVSQEAIAVRCDLIYIFYILRKMLFT